MRTREYIFTGFLPSGNPFRWYYDENKSTAFAVEMEVVMWSEQPKIGDKIKIEKNHDEYNNNYAIERVWINGALVYTRSKEKEAQQQKMLDEINYNLKRSKGLV